MDGRLPGVLPTALHGPPRNNLIGIHVGRSPRAGLKDVNGEVHVVDAMRHFVGRLGDRLGTLRL